MQCCAGATGELEKSLVAILQTRLSSSPGRSTEDLIALLKVLEKAKAYWLHLAEPYEQGKTQLQERQENESKRALLLAMEKFLNKSDDTLEKEDITEIVNAWDVFMQYNPAKSDAEVEEPLNDTMSRLVVLLQMCLGGQHAELNSHCDAIIQLLPRLQVGLAK